MTDNEIIKAMQCVIGNDANCSECTYQKVLPFPSCRMMCAKNALDLINRQKIESNKYRNRVQSQKGEITRLHKKVEELTAELEEAKAEIERLKKDCEDVIYKLEYLLCNATGNKFSKYTYPIGDMVSYVNDYIQDCCNEAVEEAKEGVKSEAIKEFAKRVKEKSIFISKGRINSENPMNYELDMEYRISMWDFDNLVKEMTEVSE